MLAGVKVHQILERFEFGLFDYEEFPLALLDLVVHDAIFASHRETTEVRTLFVHQE